MNELKKNHLRAIVLVLIIIFMLFTGTYIVYFDFDLQQDFSRWVDVATYFNNITSPFLLLFSVYLIYLTWRNTQEELMNTRKILQQQMDIQLSGLNFDKLEAVLETIKVLILSDDLRKGVPLLPDYEDIFIKGRAQYKTSDTCLNLTLEEFNEISSQALKIIKEKSLLSILNEHSIDSLSKARFYSPLPHYVARYSKGDSQAANYLANLTITNENSPIHKETIKKEILEIILFTYISKKIDKLKLTAKLVEANQLIGLLKEQGYSTQCELLETQYNISSIAELCCYAYDISVTEEFFNGLYKSELEYRFSSITPMLEEVLSKYGGIYMDFKNFEFYSHKRCLFYQLAFLAKRVSQDLYWLENRGFKGAFYYLFDLKGKFKYSQRFDKFN